MKRSQFIEYISNPDRLNDQSLLELREVVEQYPFFQAARILLIKNLHLIDHISYNNELKLAAVHISDREKLFFLLNDYDFLTDDENKRKQRNITDTQPENAIQNNIPENVFDYERGSSFYSLNETTTSAQQDELKQKNEKMSLIDSFLTKQNVEKIKITANDKNENEDFSIKSLEENDDLMTETLANILIKQKNYLKAKNIFLRLNLKFPEKSIYFAARIKEIEELINNHN